MSRAPSRECSGIGLPEADGTGEERGDTAGVVRVLRVSYRYDFYRVSNPLYLWDVVAVTTSDPHSRVTCHDLLLPHQVRC